MRAAPESLPLTFRVGAISAEGQEARDGVRATVGGEQEEDEEEVRLPGESTADCRRTPPAANIYSYDRDRMTA